MAHDKDKRMPHLSPISTSAPTLSDILESHPTFSPFHADLPAF